MLDQRAQELFRQFVADTPVGPHIRYKKEVMSEVMAHLRVLTSKLYQVVYEPHDPKSLAFKTECQAAYVHVMRIWMTTMDIPSEEAIQQMIDVNLREEGKGGDYNSGGIQFLDYWPKGSSDVWIYVHNKTLRLVSLITSGRKPNFESINDNCLDLCAYIIWLWVVDQLWNEVYT